MMVLEQKLELEQLKVCFAANESDKFALVPPSHGSVLCLCNEFKTVELFVSSYQAF